MTDSVDFKRSQQAALQAAKESKHGSILDGLALPDAPGSDDENTQNRKPLRPCTYCVKGVYQGVCGKSECGMCYGTGIELDDPIEVVQALVAWGKNFRKHHRNLHRRFNEFKTMWTEEEIERRQGQLFAEKHHSRYD